ncbi:MAG: carboxypeptidase regulatory-like domain-containing protein, partial [Blastocatellia bacterium]
MRSRFREWFPLALILLATSTAFAQRATGTISGRVVAEDGQPIPHATISVIGVGGSRRVLSGRMAIVTDEEGNFHADGLDPVPYQITANAPGYVLAPNARAGDMFEPARPVYTFIGESITITMARGGVITGKVTNAAGDPVIGIGVRAVRIKDEQGKPLGAAAASGFVQGRQTDDRGIYRLYGLAPGSYIVQAGGSGLFVAVGQNPYGSRMATYHPSSLRDAAVEVGVRSGDETSGIDIRYRGERGFGISGKVTGGPASAAQGGRILTTSILLRQVSTGAVISSTFIPPMGGQDGYALYGIPNGEYEVVASRDGFNEDGMASSPRRVIVNGRDLTGIDLTLLPNASIAGTVTLEKPADNTQKCESRRESYLEETILRARRDEPAEKYDGALTSFNLTVGVPDDKGAFLLRNLRPGRQRIEWQLPDENWYARSMTMTGTMTGTLTGATPANDPRNGLALKSGDRVTGLTIILATGASGVKGKVAATAGAKLPNRLRVHLLPAGPEAKDDLLRFAETRAESDGAFCFSHLAPGKYLFIARA